MLFRRKSPKPPTPPNARRLRELEIITARLIRAGFAGDYHSAFHGHGIEFSQVREYQPGDDIRTIDWNVTARSRVPHVKQFIEERDLTVVIAVDVSASMAFGSVDRRKIDVAMELVAVLAFAAVQNGDRVGLLLFNERVAKFIPPRRGRIHAQSLVRSALAGGAGTSGSADLGAVSRYLERVLIKRSIVVLLSDFLDVEYERPLRRLNEKHDVIAISIADPREERFPDRGLVRLVDRETGHTALVDLSRNEVSRGAAMRERQLHDAFRHIGVDVLSLSTAIPYDRPLLKFFSRRIARISP
jgi:Uncharacterized conserved protein (some members contain a von Willebrand factor type A (vWA) domain)